MPFLICLAHVLVLLLSTHPKSGTAFLHRIVNGLPISIEEAPWQVSLQVGGQHFCGGSIVGSKYILTAAHCIAEISTNMIKVRVGSKYVNDGGTLFEVAEKIVHEFNYITMNKDVALLKLKERIKYDSAARKIKLARITPKNGTEASVSGWGTTVSGASVNPSQLMRAYVKIIERKTCQETSQFSHLNMNVTRGMLCAATNGKDACQGDSGGPLVSDDRLVGIVSWGYGCAIKNFPGVYSDVAHFRKWILERIRKCPHRSLRCTQTDSENE